MKGIPIARRRGTLTRDLACNNSWQMVLLRTDRTRFHHDEMDRVVERLTRCKQVGVAKQRVTREILNGKLRIPDGKWALLVQLKDQPWLYLIPSWQDYAIASTLAEDAGLVTLLTGYQDTAGASFLTVHANEKKVIEFESCGFTRKELESTKARKSALLDTRFTSDRHNRDWWQQFEDEVAACDALITGMDAYVPLIYVGGASGRLELQAFDGTTDLQPIDYEQIDLLIFGPREALEGSGRHGRKLLQAIIEGDVEAVCAAVDAGASLSFLPNDSRTPLTLAITAHMKNRSNKMAVIRSLVESGADARGDGKTCPPLVTW